MHPMILGSVQRRATRVHASFCPFSTNALLHPSYIYVHAFTEPFAFALQPTASRAPLSPSMLRSLTPWTPRGLIESTPRRLLFRAVETRANPFSFHELSRAESHVLLLERSSRFFQLAKRLSPPPSKCFRSFLADVDSIHTVHPNILLSLIIKCIFSGEKFLEKNSSVLRMR